MNISIRQAQLYDLTAIDKIEQACHLSPWSKSLLAASFSDKNHNYVLELDGQIKGYFFTSLIADELTLENICIDSNLQGKGLGHKMMEQLLALAAELECYCIFLEVRQSNAGAIHLYQKFGFDQVGLRKDYYKIAATGAKEHALVMTKSLA